MNSRATDSRVALYVTGILIRLNAPCDEDADRILVTRNYVLDFDRREGKS